MAELAEPLRPARPVPPQWDITSTDLAAAL